MKRSAFVAGVALVAAVLAGSDAEAREDHGSIRYRKIADALHVKDLATGTSEVAPLLQFKLRLTPNDSRIDPASLELRVMVAGKETIYRANRFGAFDLPINLALYEANPVVHVNRGFAEGLTMGVDLRLRGDFAGSVAAGPVELAVRQYADAVRQAGWKYRLFAPRLSTVVLRLSPGAGGCRVGPEPGHSLAPTPLGELRVAIAQLLSDHGQRVTCDARIEEVLLESS
jgi:hypothetical protein